MNLSDLTNAVSSAGLSYVQSQIPGGSSVPMAANPAPTGSGAMPRPSAGVMGGIGLGGIVVAYFVLRFLGLLPRWLRII